MKHVIALGGLHGCSPNFCDVFKTKTEAYEYIANISDVSVSIIKRRHLGGYVELNLELHGNEYAEIYECNCNEPWIHSDSLQSENEILEYLLA